MRRCTRFAGLALCGLVIPSVVYGQEQPPDTTQGIALRVFLDCQTRCDFDHFRREIAFVNWVRDRQDAQVHVLVTSQETGGGGRDFTFDFIGLEEFAGRADTLHHISSVVDTEAEVRDGQTRVLAIGLLRYAAETPIAERIRISYQAPTILEQQAEEQDDPWNLWVFTIRAGGSFNGESQQSSFSVNGSVRASRTTEAWKHDIRMSGRYSERTVELSEGEETFDSKNFNGAASTVKSLGDHWSTGAQATANSSTFTNTDLAYGVGPAIEYNIYPYAESTRRQLVFFYTLQVRRFNWEEITIFEQTEETRLQHVLEVAAEIVQPWGSIRAEVTGRMYTRDPALHSVSVFGGFEIRIVRGLNFDAFGSFSRIKDQISLPLGDISDEDILLRRRQIGTDFRYFVNFGLSYRFGSIFNNVVNPRMDSF